MKALRRYLVAYITLGYPDEERFLELLKLIDREGADFVEIGIPPSFAKYDGPTIRRSYEHVKRVMPNSNYIQLVRKARRALSIPMIVLTYMDDYLANLGQFIESLHSIEVDSLLLPDLLIDYVDMYEDVLEMAKSVGMGITLFTSPSMPDNLIERVAPSSKFFLYYGVRPATGIPIPVDPVRLVKRVRAIVRNRMVVGFGLSANDIPEVIRAGADGIAVGTALIEAIDRGGVEEAVRLIKLLRGVVDGV